jgi:uncharacterized membrane protein YgcG
MTDYPQWSTVKAELDDPSVSAADKNRLLKGYVDAAGYNNPLAGVRNKDFADNYKEINQYAQQYNATDDLHNAARVGSTPYYNHLLRDRQQAGQKAFDEQQKLVQNDQAVGKAKTDLSNEAKKTVAQGGAGAATSDEILDPGSKGLLFFQQFIPPYQNWVGSAPDMTNDIQKVYDNLRGINFAKFRADATQLSASHGKLADSTMNLSTATNSLGGFWQGPAAQAAQQYCGTFVQNGKTVTDGTNAASQLITDQIKAIETAVLQRSQAVLQMYANDVGGFDAADVQRIIDAAKLSADDGELREMAKWNVFGNVDWGDTDCHGHLSQNVKNLASMDATNWLNSTFKPTFDQKKSSFDSVTTSTHDTVGQSFDAMNQGLGKIDANPFSDLGKGIQVPQGSGSGSGSGHGSGSGSGGSGGGSGSGGGGGGGPTMPSGAGAPSPGSMPPPAPIPPPAAVPPPTAPTVAPPVTVPSAATTGSKPETLTVQHGANTLTMAGPDSHGTMQLTTKDGSGQPKTYDIAFGTHAATGTPAPTVAPAHSSHPAPSPDGTQHITPGPDGKAVIHDGNTTITATEQPGGEVKVTVDDGSGQPTTYTLDPAKPSAATAPVAGSPVATPVAATGFTPPATANPIVAPQQGFTPPVSPTGFTDPSLAASHVSGVDPSTMTVPTAATGQTTAFGDALGGAASGGHAAADHLFGPAHHDIPGHAGVAGTDVTPIGPPGHAGLASAPVDQPAQAGQSNQPGGGMPMMGGGMGGGGAGGDQERGASQWRTYGQLFDDASPDDVVSRFSGTLDDGR